MLQASRWSYAGIADALVVTASKSIALHGVQHLGSNGGNYTVSLEVKDALSGLSLAKQTGTHSSETNVVNSHYRFDVMFNHPVHLEQDKPYQIVSLIEGPSSWAVIGAKNRVEVQGVRFSFSNSAASANGTSVDIGQFSAFLFSLR